MGITPQLAEMIFREHVYKPIGGSVLTIDKLSVYLTPDEAISLARRCKLATTLRASDLNLDTRTAAASGTNIDDRSFFKLLEVDHIEALDVSDYEGATIIHDLSQSIPASLVEAYDAVCDGGTMDNVFDPARALRALASMVRPGGRFVSVNMASNHLTPYVVFNPMWFFDFFVINGFADCHVYLCVCADETHWNSFKVDAAHLLKSPSAVFNIELPYLSFTVVLAEKGQGSTNDRSPISAALSRRR